MNYHRTDRLDFGGDKANLDPSVAASESDAFQLFYYQGHG